MSEDTIIQPKRWYTRNETFQKRKAAVDSILFPNQQEVGVSSPSSDLAPSSQKQNIASSESKKDINFFINQLKRNPKSLGDLITLEQLLAVLGEWAKQLYARRVSLTLEDAELKQFLVVLEAQHRILQKDQRDDHPHSYFLDMLALKGSGHIIKSTLPSVQSLPSAAPNLESCDKNQILQRSVKNLVQLFSEGSVANAFLIHCQKASRSLMPESRCLLAECFETSKLTTVLVSKTSNQRLEFLQTHRSWITDEQQLRVLTTTPDASRRTLKKYLGGKADVNGWRPLQKLRRFVSNFFEKKDPLIQEPMSNVLENEHLLKRLGLSKEQMTQWLTSVSQKRDAQVQESLLHVLDNDYLRGCLNLSGEQLTQWAVKSEFDPSVCKVLGKNSHFYDLIGDAKANELVDSSEYLKVAFQLHKAIKTELGKKSIFRREATQIKRYLEGWIQSQTTNMTEAAGLVEATCELIRNNERYFRILSANKKALLTQLQETAARIQKIAARKMELEQRSFSEVIATPAAQAIDPEISLQRNEKLFQWVELCGFFSYSITSEEAQLNHFEELFQQLLTESKAFDDCQKPLEEIRVLLNNFQGEGKPEILKEVNEEDIQFAIGQGQRRRVLYNRGLQKDKETDDKQEGTDEQKQLVLHTSEVQVPKSGNSRRAYDFGLWLGCLGMSSSFPITAQQINTAYRRESKYHYTDKYPKCDLEPALYEQRKKNIHGWLKERKLLEEEQRVFGEIFKSSYLGESGRDVDPAAVNRAIFEMLEKQRGELQKYVRTYGNPADYEINYIKKGWEDGLYQRGKIDQLLRIRETYWKNDPRVTEENEAKAKCYRAEKERAQKIADDQTAFAREQAGIAESEREARLKVEEEKKKSDETTAQLFAALKAKGIDPQMLLSSSGISMGSTPQAAQVAGAGAPLVQPPPSSPRAIGAGRHGLLTAAALIVAPLPESVVPSVLPNANASEPAKRDVEAELSRAAESQRKASIAELRQ